MHKNEYRGERGNRLWSLLSLYVTL